MGKRGGRRQWLPAQLLPSLGMAWEWRLSGERGLAWGQGIWQSSCPCAAGAGALSLPLIMQI